jgi:para-nitrobenzyl esterase
VWPRYTSAEPKLLYLDSEIATGPIEDVGNLKKIGHLYTTARFVLGHVYLVGTIAILLLLLLITGLVLLVRRSLRRRKMA